MIHYLGPIPLPTSRTDVMFSPKACSFVNSFLTNNKSHRAMENWWICMLSFGGHSILKGQIQISKSRKILEYWKTFDKSKDNYHFKFCRHVGLHIIVPCHQDMFGPDRIQIPEDAILYNLGYLIYVFRRFNSTCSYEIERLRRPNAAICYWTELCLVRT